MESPSPDRVGGLVEVFRPVGAGRMGIRGKGDREREDEREREV